MAEETYISPAQAALQSPLIVAIIMQHLPHAKRFELTTVSKVWRQAADDPDVWGDLPPALKVWLITDPCLADKVSLAQKRTRLYGIKPDDMRSHLNWVLTSCCANNRLAGMQWLIEYVGVSSEDLGRRAPYILQTCCRYGRLAMVQWLVSRFSLTTENILAYDRMALYNICDEDYPELVKWLVTHFELSAADCRDVYREVKRIVKMTKTSGLSLKWLEAHFGFDDKTS